MLRKDTLTHTVMARGNEREKARAKNLAKQTPKKNDDGLTPLQRKERDIAAMKQKAEAKAALLKAEVKK